MRELNVDELGERMLGGVLRVEMKAKSLSRVFAFAYHDAWDGWVMDLDELQGATGEMFFSLIFGLEVPVSRSRGEDARFAYR